MSMSSSKKHASAFSLFAALLVAVTGLSWAATGPVSLSGYALKDDQGPFLGLGATYFLALRHEKYEEAQLIDNLSFLSEQGFNYIRILSMVGTNPPWGGKEILPPNTTYGVAACNGTGLGGWSDYWAQFRQLVDRVYDDYGMRTQITIFADADCVMNTASRRSAHVNSLLSNVVAGREHKIILIEVANEYWQNGVSLEEVQQHGETLAANTDVLVALSAPAGGKYGAEELYRGTSANIATIHFSRQCNWSSIFDCDNVYACSSCLKGLPMKASNNEPVGPGSSICSEESRMRLLMAAAISWNSRLPMYVFHSRPGITADNRNLSSSHQLSNPKSFRELFQKLGLKGRFNFLRGILPDDLPSWASVRTDASGNPFVKSAGVYRSPASVRGEDFVSFPSGVWDVSANFLTATAYLTDVRICSPVFQSCTNIGVVPQGAEIRPRAYYNAAGFVITGKINPPQEGFCNGSLDYRGDNCNDYKRYQCAPGTDCEVSSCTYQGSPCYWMCHWEPYGYTCENLCDVKALTPCYQRTTQGLCEKGWGCFWGSTPPPTCKGSLDYRGDNCNDYKRYQCAPGTDCEVNSCTYQGSPCYWMCHWGPYQNTCENVCDSKPLTPCDQRITQGLCEKGWGCYWE